LTKLPCQKRKKGERREGCRGKGGPCPRLTLYFHSEGGALSQWRKEKGGGGKEVDKGFRLPTLRLLYFLVGGLSSEGGGKGKEKEKRGGEVLSDLLRSGSNHFFISL